MFHGVDRLSLDSYLAMGFVPGDHCILEGFNKLPPAHAFLFNLKTGKTYMEILGSPRF